MARLLQPMKLAKWETFLYKPLQSVDEQSLADEKGYTPLESASQKQTRWSFLAWFLLTTSLCWNVYLVLPASRSCISTSEGHLSPAELYSPASEAVELEVVKFHTGFGNDTTQYQGAPTEELDQAWWDLYGFGHARITKDQAHKLPNKTLPIPGDADHYIVELTVFHQLHCLDTIRRAFHADRYVRKFPLPDGQDALFGEDHIDHCIDSIRQSLQCSSDITPIVWQWSEEANSAKARASVVHTCRNYNKLREWALARQLSTPFDYSIHVEDDIVIPPF